MTRAPSQAHTVETKPQANVYTVLLIIAIIALGLAFGIVTHRLTAPVSENGGYGLEAGQLFETIEKLPETSDGRAGPGRAR